MIVLKLIRSPTILVVLSVLTHYPTYVTGTFSNGTASFTNSTGGTFNVGGFATGTSSSDTYVSGFTHTPTQNKLQ
jgi:hypothetical protein